MSESAQLGRADQHIQWAKEKFDASEDRVERLHEEWAEVQARWKEELGAAEQTRQNRREAYQKRLREKEALRVIIGGPAPAGGSNTGAAATPAAAADAIAQFAASMGDGLLPGFKEILQELAAKQAAHLAAAAATAAAATAAAAAAANPPPAAATAAAETPAGQQPAPTAVVEAPTGLPAADGTATESGATGTGGEAEKSDEEKQAAAVEEKAAAEAAARCDELFAKLAGEGHGERVLEMLSSNLGGRSSPY